MTRVSIQSNFVFARHIRNSVANANPAGEIHGSTFCSRLTLLVVFVVVVIVVAFLDLVDGVVVVHFLVIVFAVLVLVHL